MIYRNDNGLPRSVNDEMDSAVRAGLLAMNDRFIPIYRYEHETKGYLVRSPDEYPARNPLNFTRDNMLPLIAGLYAKGRLSIIRRFFYRTARRFFFMQNFERDRFGSTKLPIPHKFYKDSIPVSTSFPFWKEIPKIEGIEIESRTFDFADPLLPNHIWFLIKASKLYVLYPFAIIGIPFFILTLIAHSLGNHNEENQMISECYVNGAWALKLYKIVNKKWEDRSKKYWTERGEEEYHDMCRDIVGG